MPPTVFTLPIPLILLIHLHLLQYPQANKPEYDHNLFDPRVRGLRDRTKTMEDLCYFLVGRIEGSKDRARKTIPTYPCSKPSDSTSFRASLAKFAENLRHSALSLTVSSNQQTRTTSSKTASPSADGKNLKWWWKDVVVRKSLLEECSGEKFERLVLALTIHALSKGSSVDLQEATSLLRNQPRIYTSRLTLFHTEHNLWARTASLLARRQYDVRTLRANIQNDMSSNKYSTLSVDRLVALANSKRYELLASPWSAPALDLLADMLGLTVTNESSSALSVTSTSNSEAHNLPTQTQPLPIAAAHHPATLRQLSKRLFADEASEESAVLSAAVSSRPFHALAERTEAEERMLQALTHALARTRKTTDELQARLAKAKSMSKIPPLGTVDLNLWQAGDPININFEPTLHEDRFSRLGFATPGSHSTPTVEARIDEIRRSLVPQYPPIKRKSPVSDESIASSSLSLDDAEPKPEPPPSTPKSALKPLLPVTAPDTVKLPTRHYNEAKGPELKLPSEAVEKTGWQETTPRAVRTNKTPALMDAEDRFEFEKFRDAGSEYTEDEFDFLKEGESLSVRDLLLQADTSLFDIIDDDSDELDDQSFGWA
ncbi:hypothetical protein R3P38DRAFT_2925834 [Favolaschia claudopus]|uniref:HAUS augmin-like complex subunit 6 N-terminal domain-containing protein n=1 Tax=Favolaschia claudopus TaxID=2862362 RepID=A0AAW0BYD9_9AGAR